MTGRIAKILGSFSEANKVVNDARKDVKRGKPKDEVADRRAQKNGGKR